MKLSAAQEPSLSSPSLEGLVSFIKSGRCKNVVVMTGAGVSTAAGIPDFRTPGTGLYSNLQSYNLPAPEAIFEINFFRRNPKPFYVLAKELYPGQFDGTDCHYFIRLLHEKGLLLRCFTQNIDTLELSAGIPEDKLVFAHGSFATASCIQCQAPYSRDWVKSEVFEQKIPRCTKETCSDPFAVTAPTTRSKTSYSGKENANKPPGGLVKPNIVFFGENLPDRFFELAKSDLPQADLLIVMGTSLTVFPFAGLIGKVGIHTPRVLINRDPVGAATPFMLMQGHLGFDFGGNKNTRDVPLLGDCQETVRSLIAALGWDEDFATLRQQSPFHTSQNQSSTHNEPSKVDAKSSEKTETLTESKSSPAKPSSSSPSGETENSKTTKSP